MDTKCHSPQPGADAKQDGQFLPHRKSEKVLNEQLAAIEGALNVSLAPPGASSHLTLTDEEMREHHHVRYEAMRTVIPFIKRGDQLPEAIKERFAHQIRLLNNLECYISQHQEGKDGRLRGPQVEVLSNIARALGSGELQGYVKLPTGFGKTFIFAALTEATDVEKTLVLVPKSLLCEQTVEQFKKLSPGLDVRQRHGKRDDGDGKIVVSTYQYFLDASKDGRIDPKQFDLVVLDEGHKALGEATQRALARIPTTVPTVAFTATPTYSDKRSLEALMGDCWHEVSLPEGIRIGALAPVSVIVAKTSIDLSSVQISGHGYDEAGFTRAVKEAGLSKSALELYQKAFSDRSALGFCCSVAHAEEAAASFREAGIAAQALSGYTPEEQRDKAIADFKAGRIRALFSAALLIEGFDAANASVCFNMAPTASLVSAEQRGGRVLRLDPKNPLKFGIVVDFVFPNEARSVPQVFFTEILGGSVCPSGGELSGEIKEAIERKQAELKTLKVEGLELVVEAEEVLSVAGDVKPTVELGAPPEGWLTISGIAQALGKTEPMVTYAIKYMKSQVAPLMGRFAAPETGRPLTMYAPAIVPLISNFRRDALIEAGWKNFSDVMLAVNRGQTTVELQLADLIKERPDLICLGILRGGRKANDLYHPTVVDILKADTSLDYRSWPKLSLAELKKEIPLPVIVIQEGVRKITARYPEEVREGYCKPGFKERVTTYLTEEYLGSYGDSAGKITVRSLCEYLDLDPNELMTRRNTLMPAGTPPWTINSEIKNTPETIRAISAHLLVHIPAPSTWETAVRNVHSRANPSMSDRYPAIWVQTFTLPGATGKAEYVHPRFIKVMRKAEALREEQRKEAE